MVVLGLNGCGKTKTLGLLACVDHVESSTVHIGAAIVTIFGAASVALLMP